MNLTDALSEQLTQDVPYEFLVEAMSPFLNETALQELVVIAFHLRNVRGGKGERQLFRDMMGIFYEFNPMLVTLLLPLIPEYGYWKDVFYLSMTLPHLLRPTMDLCVRQLLEDEQKVRQGVQPSLMAKYIPKQKKKYKMFANSFAKHLYPEIDCHSLRMAKMRQRISALNRSTVEVKMCANEWDSIEPSEVPAIARKKYEQALLNRRCIANETREICREKFQEFLDRNKVYKEPISLTTMSEAYTPVRDAVEFFLRAVA